jgi:hypothetical protein
VLLQNVANSREKHAYVIGNVEAEWTLMVSLVWEKSDYLGHKEGYE